MKALVTNELWERIEPLLPPVPPRRFRWPGRKPLDRRMILTGILFVLKTAIAWDDLPAELGCGCGKTCRYSLRLWHQAGVWLKLHAMLLAELNGADQIDWIVAASLLMQATPPVRKISSTRLQIHCVAMAAPALRSMHFASAKRGEKRILARVGRVKMHVAALGRGQGSRRAFRETVELRPKGLPLAKTRAICTLQGRPFFGERRWPCYGVALDCSVLAQGRADGSRPPGRTFGASRFGGCGPLEQAP